MTYFLKKSEKLPIIEQDLSSEIAAWQQACDVQKREWGASVRFNVFTCQGYKVEYINQGMTENVEGAFLPQSCLHLKGQEIPEPIVVQSAWGDLKISSHTWEEKVEIGRPPLVLPPKPIRRGWQHSRQELADLVEQEIGKNVSPFDFTNKEIKYFSSSPICREVRTYTRGKSFTLTENHKVLSSEKKTIDEKWHSTTGNAYIKVSETRVIKIFSTYYEVWSEKNLRCCLELNVTYNPKTSSVGENYGQQSEWFGTTWGD